MNIVEEIEKIRGKFYQDNIQGEYYGTHKTTATVTAESHLKLLDLLEAYFKERNELRQ